MARAAKRQKELTPEEKLAQALVPVENQPYPIPENWCWTTIETINGFKSSTLDPRKNPDDYYELYSVPSCDNDYPEIIQGSDIKSSKQVVAKDDVLVCKINPRINRVWKVDQYTDNPLLASSEWIVVRNQLLNPDYLKWYFKTPTFREYMLSNVSGVGGSLMRAQPKYVKTYPLPIPPLAEQQRIVDRIESLFAKLDEAKEKAQFVIDGYEDRRSAILHQAFSGELTKAWRKQHNVLFSQWENVSLKDCGDWMGGGTPSMSHPEYWENGDIPWVTSKDMKVDVIDDTLLHVNEKGINNSSANYNEKPSVLFVMRSGILRRTLPIAYIKKPFTVNQDLRAVTPSEIDTEYLFWACRSLEKKMLETCMKSGTTVESINANALMDFEIPVAPQEEQDVIVEAINGLLQKENASRLVAQETVKHVEQMKKAIMMRAFCGELGTNYPTDEKAEELLKKMM